MPLTVAQIRERVAYDRLKFSAAEPISAEDAAFIDRNLADAEAELVEDGLCWWASSAVPDACGYAVSLIVAERVAGAFGKTFAGGEDEGRRRLAKLKNPATLDVVGTEYF